MSERIPDALRHVANGRISEQQLSMLIHAAISDATAILLSRYRRYLPIMRDAGYTAESAASRCIEELFLPRGEQPCYRLAEYLRQHCPENLEGFRRAAPPAMRRVIYLQLGQQIPELLGEFDSPYKRILRIVSQSLAGNPAMKRVDGFLEDHYHRCPVDRMLQEKERMPQDEIVGELFVRATEGEHIAQLISYLFDVLDDQDHYRRILTQANIVEIIRDYHAMRWAQSDIHEARHTRFHADDKRRILDPTVDHVRRTVVKSYLQKDVLNEDSADKYLRAVSAMLEDLAGNSMLRWYVYYEREFNGLSYEQYREAERGRFEYVMGIAKKNFLARCKEYFTD